MTLTPDLSCAKKHALECSSRAITSVPVVDLVQELRGKIISDQYKFTCVLIVALC